MREPKTKIVDAKTLKAERERLRKEHKTLVFTNGCFDVLHAGHVEYLTFARKLGDALAVGVNTDASVKRNKGENRPIMSQDDRAEMLAALEMVDYVVLFDEDEPIALISKVLPDILVKGKDWTHYVSGRDIVEKNGGKIVLAELKPGRSTTDLARRIRDLG
jgi:D-glycero-beta-D-manno-heptose 1-phosphate adenylyltransferase